MAQYTSTFHPLEFQNVDSFGFDLTKLPPEEISDPILLTEKQKQEAIAYNTRRYNSKSIRIIHDIIGAPITGNIDKITIDFVLQWQSDFQLTQDGKIGKNTLKPIVLELLRLGRKYDSVKLIIDGHNISTTGVKKLRIVATATIGGSNGRSVCDPIGGKSVVSIATHTFRKGYAFLVHTIAHELEHVRQCGVGIMPGTALGEFLGESIEILSERMLREKFSTFISDANRGIIKWTSMTIPQQKARWTLFERVRNRVRKRFRNTSMANRTAYATILHKYNVQTRPL